MRSLTLRGQLHRGFVRPSPYIMPTLRAAFGRLHPDLRLKLTLDRRDPLLSLLADRRLDLMIAGYAPSEADVAAEVFARRPDPLVCAPGHATAQRQGLSWQDLRGAGFRLSRSGLGHAQLSGALVAGATAAGACRGEVQGTEGVKGAVMAGRGIRIVSARTVQTEPAAGRIVRLDAQHMPRTLDRCVLPRRDTPLSAGQQGAGVCAGSQTGLCAIRAHRR